ncbi:MAG: tyrosine-type recombinase/integrase [Sedimentisphaerales bacterium]
MGVTVRQKLKGRGEPWYVFIHRNKTIRSYKIGDKRAADATAAELRKNMLMGKLNLNNNGSCPEFTDYANHYVEDYAKTALKRNTWTGYEAIVRLHLGPAWKGKNLDEIKRADVKQLLLQKQQQGLSSKTVENIKALISGIFTHAYEEELLQTNPALKLGRFIKKRDSREQLNPLNKEQVSRFLAVAHKEFKEHYPLLLCAFRTGMRLGELLGLAWEDINFDSNRIAVRRSFSHGYFSSPKSSKSRFIDMSNQLRQTLLEHRIKRFQKFKGNLPEYDLGKDKIHLVFPNKEGKPLDGDDFRHRVFYQIFEKANLPKFRFHDIRHTFASILLSQGEPLNYVKEQMGHASIQTTVDVYGHIVPGSNRNAVNKLDDNTGPEIKLVSSAG